MVDRVYHLDRGYECIEEKLSQGVGAHFTARPLCSGPSRIKADSVRNIIRDRLIERTHSRRDAALAQGGGHRRNRRSETSRKLILPTSTPDVRLIIVRATDVPTYVQYGAADLGVAGGDILAEHGGNGLYQPLDLENRALPLDGRGAQGFDYEQAVRRARGCASQPSICKRRASILPRKGVHVDLIKLYGSMELAPLTGLADAIVDLVSTGNTLKANNLVAVEAIAEISARLSSTRRRSS